MTALSRCPTCAAELHNTAICHRCGTLAGIEQTLTKARLRARQTIGKWTSNIPRQFQMHHFLWACAIIPLFILPPLVSLVYAIVGMRRRFGTANFEWIAIVSAVNIVASALILYKLHLTAYDLLLAFPETVRSTFQRWFFFNALPQRPPTKVVPI